MREANLGAVTPKGRATRESLLDAGEAVAERDGARGLTVAAITEQAALAKGTFYVHFHDRSVFVGALQARFREHVEAAVLGAVDSCPPGRAFLAAVLDGYLNACLAHRAVKAVLLDTQSEERPPGTHAGLLHRFEELVGPSLEAVGRTPVGVHTQILIAIISEAARLMLLPGADPDRVRAAARTWFDPPR